MRTHWEECWRFETANLTVVFEVTPCEDDPADSFEFEDDIDSVRNGTVEWFDARARVLTKAGDELGADYLGCCAYHSVAEFYESHRDSDPMNRNCTIMRRAWKGQNNPNANIAICHYFPSMIHEATRAARKRLAGLCAIHIRESAL